MKHVYCHSCILSFFLCYILIPVVFFLPPFVRILSSTAHRQQTRCHRLRWLGRLPQLQAPPLLLTRLAHSSSLCKATWRYLTGKVTSEWSVCVGDVWTSGVSAGWKQFTRKSIIHIFITQFFNHSANYPSRLVWCVFLTAQGVNINGLLLIICNISLTSPD